jgi:hypothetical protein
VKLAPCLMNYQEVDARTAAVNVDTILGPISGIIDVIGSDFYRSSGHQASLTPDHYLNWIVTASKKYGCGWACTETGIQQCKTAAGVETKAQAAAWTQSLVDYCKTNGCQWVALWGPGGEWTDDTVCGPLKSILQAQAAA